MVGRLKKEQQTLYNNAIAEIENNYINWYKINNADKLPDKTSLLNRETILTRSINPYIVGIFDAQPDIKLSELIQKITEIFMNEEQKRGLSLLQQHRTLADERMQIVNERCEKTPPCDKTLSMNIKYFTCNDAKCIMDDYYRYIDSFVENLNKRLIKKETKTTPMNINDYLELEDHININCERFNRIITDYLNLPDAPIKNKNYRRYIIRVIIISLIIVITLTAIFLAVKYISLKVFSFDILSGQYKYNVVQ